MVDNGGNVVYYERSAQCKKALRYEVNGFFGEKLWRVIKVDPLALSEIQVGAVRVVFYIRVALVKSVCLLIMATTNWSLCQILGRCSSMCIPTYKGGSCGKNVLCCPCVPPCAWFRAHEHKSRTTAWRNIASWWKISISHSDTVARQCGSSSEEPTKVRMQRSAWWSARMVKSTHSELGYRSGTIQIYTQNSLWVAARFAPGHSMSETSRSQGG